MARAIQFFTPGLPMVYYVGLLAGRNDHEARALLSCAVLPRCWRGVCVAESGIMRHSLWLRLILHGNFS
jgi:hypothetical protein